MNTLSALLILILALWNPGISLADNSGWQSHQSIRDAARIFLESLPELQQQPDALIDLGHLDSRLTLQACGEPLQTFLAPGSQLNSKATVGVRCEAPKPWSLYLPATITLYLTVYQASRPLPREHIISDQDIEAVKQPSSTLGRGYFTNKADLLGKTTRQAIRQDQVLNPGLIKSSSWVKRGEQVELIAQTENFSVSVQGEALSNGSEGEQVRVKNLSSGRVVEGIVTRRGVVRVMN
jgi:flagella basal body P-ring formation protein FlgA